MEHTVIQPHITNRSYALDFIKPCGHSNTFQAFCPLVPVFSSILLSGLNGAHLFLALLLFAILFLGKGVLERVEGGLRH